MFRIGVLGIAHSHGNSYIRQFQSFSDMSVTGYSIITPAEQKNLRSLRNTSTFEDPLELIENSDAVVVTSENSFQSTTRELAMNSGSMCFVKSPIATTEDDARSMLETEE